MALKLHYGLTTIQTSSVILSKNSETGLVENRGIRDQMDIGKVIGEKLHTPRRPTAIHESTIVLTLLASAMKRTFRWHCYYYEKLESSTFVSD